ncbi:spore germination protein GerPE [Neobacillus thermocopriae]|uniref:Spore germination protein GerPE n=1 Tax=Neobacillus thermocopriae TaxID=1215031 RepID=A0A6B3TPC0_9BACI|nr:spore germination protein GerPE [Neobacillus thermocopriae]MED3623074.1 spore germination protein GerPE [Neobacillus thermocopriae]MED3714969.1 spore germination protein GerPE [Neobacillus thermocopriae]NEX78824.1 spore germination protein GerPE [Neobacillus thermocopriae]
MFQRTSYVDNIHVKSISYSSIFQIGDSHYIYQLSRAIAVQREAEIYYDNEGEFSNYRVFTQPIHFEPIDEPISIQQHQLHPIIKVNNMNITGLSSSSMLNIGSSKHLSLEARVKHIRQIFPKENEHNSNS